MKFQTALLAALLILSTTASADTLHCRSKIVDTGMTMTDVRKYCGNPSSTAIEEHDVRSGNRVIGKTQLHIWRYNRMSGQNTAVLEFAQETLMSHRYESK